jgi:hypothetical protein
MEGYSHRNGGLCARAGLADVGASGTVTWLLSAVELIEQIGGGPGVWLRKAVRWPAPATKVNGTACAMSAPTRRTVRTPRGVVQQEDGQAKCPSANKREWHQHADHDAKHHRQPSGLIVPS